MAYYQVHGVRLRNGDRLVRHWLEKVKGERVSHCYLMLDDDDRQWFYGITTKGVEMLTFPTYMGEVTGIQTSRKVEIDALELHDILTRIDTYAKSGGKTRRLDFLVYGVLQWLKRPYMGNPLCTGFVEAVLGMDVSHCTPVELIKKVNERTSS